MYWIPMHCHMITLFLFALILLAFLNVDADRNLTFAPCSLKKPFVEKRRLFIVTCDTRIDDMTYVAWNLSSRVLRANGAHMTNICLDKDWTGFLTKPMAYVKHLEEISRAYPDNSLNHVIVMDSDTVWSANDVSDLFWRYDCARGNKQILVSSEMTCWIGAVCQIPTAKKFYGIPGLYPSYSPFINSGVIMGNVEHIKQMFEYIVANNGSYFQQHGEIWTFHDQYAVTDYAMRIARDKVAVDYHQQLTGSCFIAGVTSDKNSARCFDKNGNFVLNCHTNTQLLWEAGHFVYDNVTCTWSRKVWPNMPLQMELESLSTTPAIWHGNGRGKGVYVRFARRLLGCISLRDNIEVPTIVNHEQKRQEELKMKEALAKKAGH